MAFKCANRLELQLVMTQEMTEKILYNQKWPVSSGLKIMMPFLSTNAAVEREVKMYNIAECTLSGILNCY